MGYLYVNKHVWTVDSYSCPSLSQRLFQMGSCCAEILDSCSVSITPILMPKYRFIGPQIPVPVWISHLLRARGLEEEEYGVNWTKLTQKDWNELNVGSSGGRTLLLVHGTGLRTRPGFIGLTKKDYQRLHIHYGGRIIAFEHRAMRHQLDRNSRDLARELERGGGQTCEAVAYSETATKGTSSSTSSCRTRTKSK